MKRTATVVLGFLLVGCADPVQMALIRTDGQRITGDPQLAQKLETDRTICVGDAQKAMLSGITYARGTLAGAFAQAERDQAGGDVMKGCMASRGYALVPESQAAQLSAYYRSLQGNATTPLVSSTGSIQHEANAQP